MFFSYSLFFFILLTFLISENFFLILSLSMLARCLLNISTILPMPCFGSENCFCEINPYQKSSKTFSDWQMIFVYFLTFSHGIKEIPSCGNSMMSLPSIIHWCSCFIILDVLKRSIFYKQIIFAQLLLYSLNLFFGIVLVYSKSEYTISIVISFVFVKMIWWIYDSFEVMNHLNYGGFLTNYIGRFFHWYQEGDKELQTPDSDSF